MNEQRIRDQQSTYNEMSLCTAHKRIGGGAYEAERLKPHLVFVCGGSDSPNFELAISQRYIVSKSLMHL
jgi:hypothetical protein